MAIASRTALLADMRRLATEYKYTTLHQVALVSPVGFHIHHLSSHLIRCRRPHFTQSFLKMRSTSLTILFFALFALFSTLAYAAPVDPRGAISKRQQCGMYSCKDAVDPPTTTSSDSTDVYTAMGKILAAFYNNLISLSSTSNSSDSAPVAVYVVPGTPSVPATQPTGL